MKVTLNDISKERLFFKRVCFRQGEHMQTLISWKGDYLVYFEEKIHAVIGDNELRLLNTRNKRRIELISMIRNQFSHTDLYRKTSFYDCLNKFI